MKNLITRTLTGIVFLIVLVGCIVWNKYAAAGLFYVVAMLGFTEFLKLMSLGGFKPEKLIAYTSATVVYWIIALNRFAIINDHFLILIFPLLVSIVVVELFRKSEFPVSNISFSIMGILYIICPLATLNFFTHHSIFDSYIGMNNSSVNILLGFFIILWSNDTGAYLFGSVLGKNKLFERVSPNKTWEGFFGGVLLAFLAAYIFSYFTESSSIHWISIASIIVVFGTLGDLTESQIKRSCGVKDSGNLLPGHGGVLDRFDGVLFAAPFVLTYLLIISGFNA
ncbi:MAG: phosphatidate cytidylyltransferase [Flavobacteriales bacterium]